MNQEAKSKRAACKERRESEILDLCSSISLTPSFCSFKCKKVRRGDLETPTEKIRNCENNFWRESRWYFTAESNGVCVDMEWYFLCWSYFLPWRWFIHPPPHPLVSLEMQKGCNTCRRPESNRDHRGHNAKYWPLYYVDWDIQSYRCYTTLFTSIVRTGLTSWCLLQQSWGREGGDEEGEEIEAHNKTSIHKPTERNWRPERKTGVELTSK